MFDENNIVFLVPSHGTKPSIVLHRLVSNTWVGKYYNISAIVEQQEGRCVETIKSLNIPFEVAESPHSLNQAFERLPLDTVDYIISCGWGWKIDSTTLSKPTKAALNCHSSYLPNYRGPSTYYVQWAHAEKKGGASIHYLNESFDDGNIICREKFTIGMCDSPTDILRHASELTTILIREALLLVENDYKGEKNTGGCYYSNSDWTKNQLKIYHYMNILFRLFGIKKRLKINSTE